MTRAASSAKAVCASSKVTRCLVALAAALRGSQRNVNDTRRGYQRVRTPSIQHSPPCLLRRLRATSPSRLGSLIPCGRGGSCLRTQFHRSHALARRREPSVHNEGGERGSRGSRGAEAPYSPPPASAAPERPPGSRGRAGPAPGRAEGESSKHEDVSRPQQTEEKITDTATQLMPRRSRKSGSRRRRKLETRRRQQTPANRRKNHRHRDAAHAEKKQNEWVAPKAKARKTKTSAAPSKAKKKSTKAGRSSIREAADKGQRAKRRSIRGVRRRRRDRCLLVFTPLRASDAMIAVA
jgi:hypothetical protein